MASVVASQVLSQCQVVAGSVSGISSTESLRGKAVVSAVSPVQQKKAGSMQISAMSKKKVNAYDEAWSKKFFGYGYFAENSESAPIDIVKTLEKKKLLTGIEKAGLLSKAEGFGLSLSKIEKLGLLSKAESLGLLALAEKFATSSPAALASLSLPLLVGAIATPIIIPDDSTLLLVIQYTLAALLAGGAGTLFISSIVLGALQEE
eukprot:jgi/Mesen1/7699/ME000405S06984